MTGMMIVSGVAAVALDNWLIVALSLILGLAGEAFRRMLPPKPREPSNEKLNDFGPSTGAVARNEEGERR